MRFGSVVVIKRDGTSGSTFPIVTDITFGSHPSVDVQLDVDGIAQRQCRIVPNSTTKRLHLEILDDNFVTSINDKPVGSAQQEIELNNNDVLHVKDRRFKILYANNIRPKQSKTPVCVNSSVMTSAKKRRSIFDSTPPTVSRTPQKGSLRTPKVTEGRKESPKTPQIRSPKQPKSILSAKKNILVTRTPTMSPKVVRWGTPTFQSPTKSPTSKKASKPSRQIVANSGLSALRRRSVGSLDEKIKKLAGITQTRRSSSENCSTEDSIRLEVPETPEKNNSQFKIVPFDQEEKTAETSAPSLNSSKQSKSFRRSSVASASSNDSTKTSAKSFVVTPKTENAESTQSTVSSVSSRRSRSSFKTSSVDSPLSTSLHKKSIGRRSSMSSTRSRQSFKISPLVEGNILSSTVTESPNFVDLSVGKQPKDSFGSLSVSDVDSSLFDGTVLNQTADTSVMKTRRSSSSSAGTLRRVSRSPKTKSLIEVEEEEEEEENAAEQPETTREDQIEDNEIIQVQEADHERSSDDSDEPMEEVDESNDEEMEEEEEEDVEETENDPELIEDAETSKEEVEPKIDHESEVVQSEANSLPLQQSTNQEPRSAAKKTWANVLKKSIASGSPFKISKRTSMKKKSSIKANILKKLPKESLRRMSDSQIVAAFASTGHALSPPTVIINKKIEKLFPKGTPLKSRDSSLGYKTFDSSPQMFVSPQNTPDHSEAVARAAAFVKTMDNYQHSPSELDKSNDAGLNEMLSPSLRRSARISSPLVVARSLDGIEISRSASKGQGSSKPLEDNLKAQRFLSPAFEIEQLVDSQDNVEGDDLPHESSMSAHSVEVKSNASSSGNNLDLKHSKETPQTPKVAEISLDNNLQGMKKLLQTPKSIKSPENNLAVDLTGMKKLLQTPKNVKSPENNLAVDLTGMKKLLKTPKNVKSPENNLAVDLKGMKKLLQTPKEVKEPENNLDGSFKGVKKLLSTPKEIVSPLNNLDGNFKGVAKMLATPKISKSPKNELDGNFGGMRRLLQTPTESKSPLNNLDCDYKGTKKLFGTRVRSSPRSVLNESALETLSELVRSPVVKRKSDGEPQPKAKRRKAMAVEIPPEEFEDDMKLRTPSTRSRLPRANKVEIVTSGEEAKTPAKSAKKNETKAKKALKKKTTKTVEAKDDSTSNELAVVEEHIENEKPVQRKKKRGQPKIVVTIEENIVPKSKDSDETEDIEKQKPAKSTRSKRNPASKEEKTAPKKRGTASKKVEPASDLIEEENPKSGRRGKRKLVKETPSVVEETASIVEETAKKTRQRGKKAENDEPKKKGTEKKAGTAKKKVRIHEENKSEEHSDDQPITETPAMVSVKEIIAKKSKKKNIVEADEESKEKVETKPSSKKRTKREKSLEKESPKPIRVTRSRRK